MSLYNFNYEAGKGLQCQINKDELSELMKHDKEDEARRDNQDYQEECKNEREDWDMSNSDYL